MPGYAGHYISDKRLLAVPGAVKQWAVLADMGFPYQQPAGVQVHAPTR